MGQSEFMVKKQNLPPLLSFSALMVCILPHCRLRDWCGNMRKASGHVVCRLDQSASFRIYDSTFYLPHSAIPHFTHSRLFKSLPGTLQSCCLLPALLRSMLGCSGADGTPQKYQEQWRPKPSITLWPGVLERLPSLLRRPDGSFTY